MRSVHSSELITLASAKFLQVQERTPLAYALGSGEEISCQYANSHTPQQDKRIKFSHSIKIPINKAMVFMMIMVFISTMCQAKDLQKQDGNSKSNHYVEQRKLFSYYVSKVPQGQQTYEEQIRTQFSLDFALERAYEFESVRTGSERSSTKIIPRRNNRGFALRNFPKVIKNPACGTTMTHEDLCIAQIVIVHDPMEKKVANRAIQTVVRIKLMLSILAIAFLSEVKAKPKVQRLDNLEYGRQEQIKRALNQQKLQQFGIETLQSLEKKCEFQNKLRIVSLNVQGITRADKLRTLQTKIRGYFEDDKIDIMVLNEVKNFEHNFATNPLYKMLIQDKYYVKSATNNSRGGVVIIANRERVSIEVVDEPNLNTSLIVQVEYNETTGSSKKFYLVAVYVNPQPQPQELKAIEIMRSRIQNLADEALIPIVIIGDANYDKFLIKHLKGFTNQIQVAGITNTKTQLIQNRTPDIILSKSITKSQAFTKDWNYADHLAIYYDIEALIYEKPYTFYTRKQVSSVMQNNNFIEEFVYSASPMISLEESIEARIVSAELPKRSNGLRIRKVDYDQPTDQIKQQLNYQNQAFWETINEQLERLNNEKSQDEMLSFYKLVQNLKKTTRKDQRGDGLHIAKYFEGSNGNGQTITYGQAVSNEKLAKLFNEKYNVDKRIRTQVVNKNNQTVYEKVIETNRRFLEKLKHNYITVEEHKKLRRIQNELDEEMISRRRATTLGFTIFEHLYREIKEKYKDYYLQLYETTKKAVDKAIKESPIEKGHGNDLIQTIIKTQHYQVQLCACQAFNDEFDKKRKIREDFYQESTIQRDPTPVIRQCTRKSQECRPTGEIKYNLQEIIAERITLMMLTNNTPAHLINVKLAMFSKNGTCAVKGPQEIRPIGVLPIFYKVMEKAFKNIVDDLYPQMFEVQPEQAGFQKGRSVLDHTTLLMQRIVNNEQQNRMWVLIDMTSAYDNVKHDLLLEILQKRAQGFKMKIGPSAQTIQHPLATLFLQFLRKSYDLNTMTIGPHLIRLNQGLIQGGGLSPPLFNLYIQEMFQEDEIINKKNENYRQIVEHWTKSNFKISQQIDRLDINCAFADDDIMETNEQELQEWDYKRLPVWNKYGMTLNAKTKVLVKKLPQGRKKILLEASKLEIEIVTSAKYLGTQLNPLLFKDKSDQAAAKYIQYISDRLKVVKILTKPQHQFVSLRTQQIYFDSLYRFLVTPYVITNLITVEQALEIWRIISKKVHKLPQSMEKDLQMCLIPQPDLVRHWNIVLEGLARRTPIYEYKEVKHQLEKVLKSAESQDVSEYFDGYKRIADKVNDPNYKSSYVLGQPHLELDRDENLRDPEWLCIGCMKSFVVRKNQKYEAGDYITVNQMENNYSKDNYGVVEAYTDASFQKDQYGKNYAAIGIFIPCFDRKVAKEVVIRNDIIEKNKKRTLARNLTNNVAELMAVIEAIQQIELLIVRKRLRNVQRIVIRSDSKYVVSTVNEYLNQWIKENKLAHKNIEMIITIREKMKAMSTKFKVPVELQHIKAHQHITTMPNYYNHIADYLADTALSGITKAPRIKVIIPKAESQEPIGMCQNCKVPWKLYKFEQRLEGLKHIRSTIKQQMNLTSVQVETQVFETKFQKNSNVEVQQKIKASKFTQFINQCEDEKQQQQQQPLVNQMQFNQDILTGLPYQANTKQIRFCGITALEAKQKDNKLFQLLVETNNMTQGQKQELAENIALGEKAQISSYNEIVAVFKRENESSNIDPQQIHTKPLIKAAVRKLINDKRNQVKINLLEEIFKEKLDRDRLENCDKFFKFNKVKRTNFEEIAHQGIALRYSLIFNQEKSIPIKNVQWNSGTITSQVKKDYTDHLPTIIEAIRLAKGFTANGVIICKICKQKPLQLIRGSLAHLMRCNKETVEKMRNKLEESKLNDRDKAITKAVILNLTNRHQLLEDSFILYYRIKENLINPSLIKHLAGVIAWSKNMIELHQNNLGRDITALLSYQEFEETNAKRPKKNENKVIQERLDQLQDDDQQNVIEALAQQSIKAKIQKLESQAKRSNVIQNQNSPQYYEEIIENQLQQVNYVKERVPQQVISNIATDTLKQCVNSRRKQWTEMTEREIYHTTQEAPHKVQIIVQKMSQIPTFEESLRAEITGRGQTTRCKVATLEKRYMKSKKMYDKVLARAEKNAKFQIKKLIKAQNSKQSKLDFAEIGKTRRFMQDSNQQAQNVHTQAKPIIQIFQTTHIPQSNDQATQLSFTTVQKQRRFKTKPDKIKDLKQAKPTFNIQRPPPEEMRAIKAARAKLLSNSSITYNGFKKNFLDHLLEPFDPTTKNVIKATIFRRISAIQWKKLRNNVKDHLVDIEITNSIQTMLKNDLNSNRTSLEKKREVHQQLHFVNDTQQILIQTSQSYSQSSLRSNNTLSSLSVPQLSQDQQLYGQTKPPLIQRSIENPESQSQGLSQFTSQNMNFPVRNNGQNLAHFQYGSQEHLDFLLQMKPKPQNPQQTQ